MSSTLEAPSPALVEWLCRHRIAADDDDALVRAFADADVVAIGEPGHGAHEPLAFRNRIVRLLLERNELGAVALESGWLEAGPLDDWIRTGQGDIVALARHSLSWGFGRLDDNVALLRLLREHRLRSGSPVRFFGFDIPGGDERGEVSGAAVAPRTVAAFLRRLASDEADPLAGEVEAFAAQLQRPVVRALSDAQRMAARDLHDRIDRRLARSEDGSPTADDASRAVRAASLSRAVFEMFCRWPDIAPGLAPIADDAVAAMLEASGWRDLAMADNVMWIRSRLANKRLLVFAANGHVIADAHRGGLWARHPELGLPAGHHLRARLGDRYRVVLTASESSLPGETAAAEPATIDAFLSRGGDAPYAIDLRTAPADPWLDSVQTIGTHGPYPQAFVPRRAADLLVRLPPLTAAPGTPP